MLHANLAQELFLGYLRYIRVLHLAGITDFISQED